MSEDTLAQTIKAAMKAAMKAKDKDRLSTIRLILSEFKRIEVDERIEVDDARALAVLDKMVKQRRDSAEQYANAGRQKLADQENAEIDDIHEFLSTQLTAAELYRLIDEAIAACGASGMATLKLSSASNRQPKAISRQFFACTRDEPMRSSHTCAADW